MEMIIDPTRLLAALSLCLDFTNRGLNRHHQRVAYIVLSLAEELGLSREEKILCFTASIVHDAGVSTWREKKPLAEFEVDNPWEHCYRGCKLISQVNFLKPAADIILSHHDFFSGPNPSGRTEKEIPLASRLIHLADRLDVLLNYERCVLDQWDDALKRIKKLAGRVFDPDLVKVLEGLAHRESFWFDLITPFMVKKLDELLAAMPLKIGRREIRELASLFAAVIDAKSTFTYHHSRRVAAVAVFLAKELGLNEEELVVMEVAGLLHDLGKLSVPEEILEKPAPLTAGEYNIIKLHVYYTYRILEEAGDLGPVPAWAGYHHEKLNGQGYPFHLNASQLSLPARIMAVSDIFTALREDRPYRRDLEREKIEVIMIRQKVDGSLDPEVVEACLENYLKLEDLLVSFAS